MGGGMGVEGGAEFAASDAFDLVNAARLESSDWQEAGTELDLSVVREAIDRSMVLGVADFEAERTLRENENQDRAAFQIASLEKHLNRKREIHLTNRDKHFAFSRKGLALAEEKKLKTLEETFHAKRDSLMIKVRLDSNRFEVCAGVIRVE